MRALLKINVLAVTISALIVAVLVAIGATSNFAEANDAQDQTPRADAQANNPPPRPAWVKADGSVDKSKFPKCMKAVGQNGRTLVKPNGKPLCVPREDLAGDTPPRLSKDEAVAAGRSAQSINKKADGGGLMIVKEKRPSAADSSP